MPTPYADPTPQAAPPGGENGARTGAMTLDRAMLAQLVAQREAPAATEPESTSPPQPAEGSPESPVQPTEQDEAGRTNLTSEEQPAGSEEAAGEPGNEVPTDENALTALAEALKGLNPDAQKHLMEMAEDVARGDTSIGQLKRGHRLATEFTQQIETLKRELEDLKARGNGREARDAAPVGTPANVAALKSLEDVKARQAEAKGAIRALEDWLEANPEGGRIGDRDVTRRDVLQSKRSWEDELDALPNRAEEIRAQGEAQLAQRQAKTAFAKDFPWISDPENPRAIAVQERLAAEPWLKSFRSPEYAAAVMLLGEQAMQAELAARKGGRAAVAARPAAGKVPAAKPHQAPGTVAPRMGGGVSVEQALKSVQESGSRSSLTALLEATGR